MSFFKRLKRRIQKRRAQHRRRIETCSSGWKANTRDARDDVFESSASIKKETNLLHLLPPADEWLYQGSIGSCVAHGIANQIYAEEVRTGHVRAGTPISRLYLYYFARWLEKRLPPTGSGAYPRLAYKALMKTGVPYEPVWNYKTRRANVCPSNRARRFAMSRSRLRYKWIMEPPGMRANAIRRALSEGRVVTFGTQVTQAMMDYKSGSGKVIGSPLGKKKFGGHYMAIIGYEKNHFIVANSWHGREILLLDAAWMEWPRSSNFGVVTV